ncbi:hypothetical protein ONZ51_g8125 [Trametes cubensis]|uniref:DUF6534 domain-containing protein n=1 Tax=Trametes cubensis TaxID=1111947 RepID=A0AAD7TNU7_9APHY|nr:hypothetical protein ONZ51_g8125 [Trametes cubensis]
MDTPFDTLNGLPGFMSESSPAQHEANLGALLIGTYLGLMLYGLSVHQAYVFYTPSCKETSWILKTAVAIILILETIHSALCIYANYTSLIIDTFQDNVPHNTHCQWSINILSVFAATIFCLTQSIYAWNVIRVLPVYGLVVAIVVAVLATGQLGTVIAASVLLYKPRSERTIRDIRWLSCVHSAMVVVASQLLAGVLICYLRRSRTGFARSDHIIRTLILYICNTGLLVGISSILSLILVLVWPQSLLSVAVEVVATNFYAVSLLAQLNSRQELRTMDTQSSTMTYEATRLGQCGIHVRSSPSWPGGIFNPTRRSSQGLQHLSVGLYPRLVGAIDVCVTTEIIRQSCDGSGSKEIL